MEREEDKRLVELREQGITLYSISRLDTINRCLYEAYRTYKLGERGRTSVYGSLGGCVHDVLEGIMNNEKTEADLLPAMQKELDDLDMLGIEFPKDRNGGDSIRQGWVDDITHFCNTYKAPKGKFITEELFIYKTPKGRHLIGYIDLQKVLDDNTIEIYDYKTSSMYSKADMIEHGRQLVTYALGKEQEGKTVKRVAWIFLKFATIKYLGRKTSKSKEKTEITKVIERKKIATEMADVIDYDLTELGYDEMDIECIIAEFKQKNSFDILPEEIRNKYKVLPYVCYYELTDEIKQECIDYIDGTIDKWEALGEEESEYIPRSFTKTQKNGKVVPDTFFCGVLCAHGDKCKYLHDYYAQLDTEGDNEDDDLF